jgi:hypothetical protein
VVSQCIVSVRLHRQDTCCEFRFASWRQLHRRSMPGQASSPEQDASCTVPDASRRAPMLRTQSDGRDESRPPQFFRHRSAPLELQHGWPQPNVKVGFQPILCQQLHESAAASYINRDASAILRTHFAFEYLEDMRGRGLGRNVIDRWGNFGCSFGASNVLDEHNTVLPARQLDATYVPDVASRCPSCDRKPPPPDHTSYAFMPEWERVMSCSDAPSESRFFWQIC